MRRWMRRLPRKISRRSNKSIDCRSKGLKDIAMKLRFERVWSIVGVALTAGILLSGCASTPEPVFTADPIADGTTNSGRQPARSHEEGIIFQVGDQVTISFSD